MGKIICDICGATYPETENQCPICGTAKTEASITAMDTAAQGDDFAYVKGGRFSQSNVKRHSNNRELPRTAQPKVKPETQKQKERPTRPQQPEKKTQDRSSAAARRERKRRQEKESSSNLGLIIIAIILVMAIVAICAFLVMRWMEEQNAIPTDPSTTNGQINNQTNPSGSGSTPPAGPVSIPCTGLRLPVPECTFANVGDTLQISPQVQPEDTTETVMYISSDERIATVSENGIVTAVANGTATIYVYCGSFKVELAVTCNVGIEPEPTVPPTTPPEPTVPTEPPLELKLNRTEFTLRGYGSGWNVYDSSCGISSSEITWSSADETIATITNGKVVAVGNGVTYVFAEYKGQKVSCKVVCKDVVIANFSLSRTEFTIAVGGSYTLVAYDENDLRIDPSELKFYVTDAEEFISVDENGKITGLKNNLGHSTKYRYVYVEYKGEVLKCVVHVKNAE